MTYRTKTYIAGDWTGDANLIQQLYKWNDSNYWALHFVDAHELTQARDTSLYCSIKHSLSERLRASKKFVLIVGDHTDSLTKGGCQYCSHYYSWTGRCAHGGNVDYRSYIEYECEQAYKSGLQIVVIYNYASVQKSKCPEILRNTGVHINGFYRAVDGEYYWNYPGIKTAIMGS